MPNKYTLSVSEDQNIDITLEKQQGGFKVTFTDTESLYAFARFVQSNFGAQIGDLCDDAINNHMDTPTTHPTISLDAPNYVVNHFLHLLAPVEINEEFKAEATDEDIDLSKLSLSDIFNAGNSTAPASKLYSALNNVISAEKAEATEKEIHRFELNLDADKKMELTATVANGAYSLTFDDMDQAFAFNEWISNIGMNLQDMISYQASNPVASEKFTFAIDANQFATIKTAVTDNQAIFGGSAPTVEVHHIAEEKHSAVEASIVPAAAVTVHNEDSDSDFEPEDEKQTPTETASLLGASLTSMMRSGSAAAQAVQSAASSFLGNNSDVNEDGFVEVELQEMKSKNTM